ncbi:MAG: radical SAM protein [Thermoproteota archaeon]
MDVEIGYDPFELADKVKRAIMRESNVVEERRYYRFRGGRWYGGTATGDVVGCNLRCGFCWSWREASHVIAEGFFHKPEDVFKRLTGIADARGYKFVRLSGGEPALSRKHVLKLLELFEDTRYKFILETNGILIGADTTYAEELAKYRCLTVRVSLKGTSEDEFHALTSANPSFFNHQLNALKNLVDAGFEPGERVYAAVMLSFSAGENYEKLKTRLA